MCQGGSAARSWDDPQCHTLLAPSALELAPHYANGKASAGHRRGVRLLSSGSLRNCSKPIDVATLFSSNALNRRAFVFSARQQSTGWLQPLTVVVLSAEPLWLHLNVSQSDGRHQRTADLHV